MAAINEQSNQQSIMELDIVTPSELKKFKDYHQLLIKTTREEKRNMLSEEQRQSIARDVISLFEEQEKFKDLMESFDFIKVDIMMKIKIWETIGKTKNEFDAIYPTVKQIAPQGKKIRDQLARHIRSVYDACF